MSGFARDNKGLKETFPQSGRQLHEPSELSEFVQLVHPIFGRLSRLGMRERVFLQVDGAASAVVVQLETPPEVVRLIEYAHASHDDPTARTMTYALDNNTAGVQPVIQSSTFDSPTGAAIGQFALYPLKRQVLCGPGEFFVVRVSSIVAGGILSLEVCFTDYSAADEPPTV